MAMWQDSERATVKTWNWTALVKNILAYSIVQRTQWLVTCYTFQFRPRPRFLLSLSVNVQDQKKRSIPPFLWISKISTLTFWQHTCGYQTGWQSGGIKCSFREFTIPIRIINGLGVRLYGHILRDHETFHWYAQFHAGCMCLSEVHLPLNISELQEHKERLL